MGQPLPPEIEVVEELGDDVRFVLPRRTSALALLRMSALLIGFGLIGSIFFGGGAFLKGLGNRGFPGRMIVGVLGFPVVFFGGIGLLIALGALLRFAARPEIALLDGRLRAKSRRGLLGWSRSVEVSQVRRFIVSDAPAVAKARSRKVESAPAFLRPLVNLGTLANLSVELDDGRSLKLAGGYPRALLLALSDALSERCERMNPGRSFAPAPTPWKRDPEPVEWGSGRAASAPELPNVPALDLSKRPGLTLRYRLKSSAGPGCILVGALVAALFWNGVVSIFVYHLVIQFRAGQPDWFHTAFMVPFVLIGLALIGFVLRSLLVVAGLGPTDLEISDHPLAPGASSEAVVTQAGRLVRGLNALTVTLDCEEKATYRQGTSTRTESRTARSVALFRQEAVELSGGMPFAARFDLTIPDDAMHSFKSAHNQITWKLVVKADVRRWPNFTCDFPIIVHPPLSEGGRT